MATVKKPAPLFSHKDITIITILVIAAILVIGLAKTFHQKMGGGAFGMFSVGQRASDMSMPPASPMPGYDYGEEYAARGGGVMAPGVTAESVTLDRKIARNGNLDLLVTRAEDAAEDIRLVAFQFGGVVESIQLAEADDRPVMPYERTSYKTSGTGYITIRVPAARFDEALRAVKAVAIDVESESVQARDVTEQFVDIEARLKNLRAEEAQYQEIMDRADTVEETLNVAARLYDVRGRIESTEAQMKYLSSEVEMSTITATLTVESNVEVLGIRWRPLTQAKESVQALLRDLAGYGDFLIAFVIRLPVVLLWLGTIALALLVAFRIFIALRRLVKRIH